MDLMMDVDKSVQQVPMISKERRRIFDPPLANQRYSFVQNFIEADSSITSVTDLGCGQGRILLWLKKIPQLVLANFLDCDSATLEIDRSLYFEPLLMECMFGRQETTEALAIKVYQGNITVPDEALMADCFLLIEVIEHMPLSELERCVRTIFGYYQPKNVVVSTPNFEFNHLLKPEEGPQFRHADHKFEFTRFQFELWAQEIVDKYDYSVQFSGVGHLPGSEPYGPCTQIAIFRRRADRRLPQTQADNIDLLIEKLDFKENVNSFLNVNKIVRMYEYEIPGLKFKSKTSTVNWDDLNDGEIK